jgi:medium-chain acyl-[acyl-carrier-protein] hydrolase
LGDRRGIAPVHLFVGGCRAPDLPEEGYPAYNLPDSLLIELLRSLQGVPEEALDEPELMKIVLPIIRADFEAYDTYEYNPGPPLLCPITAFVGKDDRSVCISKVHSWSAQAVKDFRIHVIPGNHFFLHTHARMVLEIIQGHLDPSQGTRVADSAHLLR